MDGVDSEAVEAPSKAILRARKFAAKAKKLKAHYCSICDHAATGPKRLANHLSSNAHRKKAARAANSST
jgi:hypothetical protein